MLYTIILSLMLYLQGITVTILQQDIQQNPNIHPISNFVRALAAGQDSSGDQQQHYTQPPYPVHSHGYLVSDLFLRSTFVLSSGLVSLLNLSTHLRTYTPQIHCRLHPSRSASCPHFATFYTNAKSTAPPNQPQMQLQQDRQIQNSSSSAQIPTHKR